MRCSIYEIVNKTMKYLYEIEAPPVALRRGNLLRIGNDRFVIKEVRFDFPHGEHTDTHVIVSRSPK